jgi:hypothetical protein
MNEIEPDLVEMMKNHELVIKRLYEAFAAVFPGHQDLWKGLIRDEERHALWIEKLSSYPSVDRWLRQNIQVKLQAIKSSIGYIESMIIKARAGDLKPVQALSIARDVENALIEKQFSRLNNSSSEKINSIMASLTAETEKHRNKIMEAIDAGKHLDL